MEINGVPEPDEGMSGFENSGQFWEYLTFLFMLMEKGNVKTVRFLTNALI